MNPADPSTATPLPSRRSHAVDVHQQAHSLLEEVTEVNRSQTQIPARTGGMVLLVAGVIVMLGWLYSLALPADKTLPLAAPGLWPALALLGITGGVYLRWQKLPHPKVGLILAVVVTLAYSAGFILNRQAPLFMLAAPLAFLHLVCKPRDALIASVILTALGASVAFEDAGKMHFAVANRLVLSAVLCVVIMQAIARQKLKLSVSVEHIMRRLTDWTQELQADLGKARSELEQATRIDSQTGLLNGHAYQEALISELSGRDRSRPLALMSLRFNRADEFLAPLSPQEQDLFVHALVQQVRDVTQALFLGRTGKWEFSAAIEMADTLVPTRNSLHDRLTGLALPLTVGTLALPVLPRMGGSCWPDDGDTAGLALHRSEIALMTAEYQGKSHVLWFEPQMESTATDRTAMIQAVKRAIQHDEFELQYQPIISLAGGPLRKAEALIRWNDPVKGRVPPIEFIPMAESIGQINDLTDWVLARAVAQVRRWRETLDPNFQLSVNVPPAYLEWVSEHVGEALERLSGLQCPPGSVVLEITEGALLNVTTEILQVLSILKGMGFEIALDDFGVGYSSFGQLDRLPLNSLKIDKSFVDEIENSPRRLAVCGAIIRVGHELGFTVVAEGVESEGQRDLLARAGCDFAQGYVYSKPVSPADLEAFAATRR